MKRSLIIIAALFYASLVDAQDLKTFSLYKPGENAEQKLQETVVLAKKYGRHVFVQIGGNWCIWCARFNDLVTKNLSIDSLIQSSYNVYHLNYSKDNKNEKLLEKYGYPQRFGFPVFLILNSDGKLIHTQNSVYLEDGKGYNEKAVLGFLSDWAPAALDPQKYKQ